MYFMIDIVTESVKLFQHNIIFYLLLNGIPQDFEPFYFAKAVNKRIVLISVSVPVRI